MSKRRPILGNPKLLVVMPSTKIEAKASAYASFNVKGGYEQESNMFYRTGRCAPIPKPMISKIMGLISTASQAIPVIISIGRF
jgi:hypothetical protein